MNGDYVQPTIDFVVVAVEEGFQQSNSQQQPSPWEDM